MAKNNNTRLQYGVTYCGKELLTIIVTPATTTTSNSNDIKNLVFLDFIIS